MEGSPIILSSKLTDLSFVGALLLFPLILGLMAMFGLSGTLDSGIVIYLVINLALLILLVITALYLSKARLDGGRFYMKKYFREERTYLQSQLSDVKSYQMRRGSYTILTFLEGAEKHRYLIVTADSIFFKDKVRPEEMLKELAARNKV